MLLLQDGRPTWVMRDAGPRPQALTASASSDEQMAAALTRMVTLQISGPSTQEASLGLAGALPEEATLAGVEVVGAEATVRIDVPAGFLDSRGDEILHDELIRLGVRWQDLTPGLASLRILARRPGEAEYVPLADLLPPLPPQPQKPEAPSGPDRTAGQPPASGQPQFAGGLTGASIFISPGHGWENDDGNSTWGTQRSVTLELIEDHLNGEICLQYLLPYLWNAGARVYPTRERDMRTNMVIVDSAAATYTGTWTSEAFSDAYGGDHRWATTVAGAPTATATFRPNVPVAGLYAVYVWYRPSGAGTTTTDARITVNHGGDATTWTQNQTRDGYTWKYIGTYHFNAGTAGTVVITNQSATAGNRVIADAIRLGGGIGDLADPAGGSASGYPRWEESGRYFSRFMGNSTWNGVVSSMPLYAVWEHEPWETAACYLSIHNNAAGGTGTETYYDSSSPVAGSSVLATSVHNQLISDIRAGWNASWANRGVKTAGFTEIDAGVNGEMPSALTELAFFDTVSDANALKDPRFRLITARAMYQGLVDFFASQYGLNATYLPEPPANFRALSAGSGSVTLSWNAPASGTAITGGAATGYRLYHSTDGLAFDNGTTLGNVLTTTVSGLAPEQVHHFRLTATNAGGESFPTETLAARAQAAARPTILIVNGFDRLDAAMNIPVADQQGGGTVQRGYLNRMNTYDYVRAHADAVAATGRDFDSCANEAVAASQVNLTDYDTVLWILGEESTDDDTFNATEQTKVQAFLTSGGNLFVSGSEIAYDLDDQNNGRTFCNSQLRTDFVSSSAGTRTASGNAGSIFDGVTLAFDDGSTIYNVDSADVLSPLGGAVAAMAYGGGGSSLDTLESVASWWDPNDSGSTNADATSTFTLAASPVYQGAGSGDLFYVWGTGTFIREHNSVQPSFADTATLSAWVHGDNSGNQVRLAVRDADNDIWTNAYTTVDFTGWRQIVWNSPSTDHTLFATVGNGTYDPGTVRLESIQVLKGASSPAQGHLHFDDIAVSGAAGSGTAAIQYDGACRLVLLGFPFETITSSAVRNDVMDRVLTFFAGGIPGEPSGLFLQ